MILPTKHLDPDRSLLAVGADCLALLDDPKTVSRLWEDFKVLRFGSWRGSTRVTFDWFVLALDVLYATSTIDLVRGLIVRAHQ